MKEEQVNLIIFTANLDFKFLINNAASLREPTIIPALIPHHKHAYNNRC